MTNEWSKAEKVLKNSGIAIIPTDTIYGVVGRALSEKTVERIYDLKGRDDNKPCIILVTSYKDLEMFGIVYDKKVLEKFWPGKVSVILPIESLLLQKKSKYLHRGTNTLSFRMIGPRNRNLYNLIKQVGPLVAPSANPQGLAPALRKSQARKYFKDKVDAYVCGGTRNSKPSTLVSFTNGELAVIRQGAVKIS